MTACLPRPGFRAHSRGFTLMEVAVAIVIVGIGLMYVLEGLNTAKLTAAHTHNMKLARELALLTLGEIESGVFQEDIESGLRGSYAQEDYPDFTYEVLVGDEAFPEQAAAGDTNAWSLQRAREEEREREAARDDEDDKDKKEQTDEPFEKIKIRVTFPKFNDLPNDLTLERWVPWKQVYGESEEAAEEKQKKEQEP